MWFALQYYADETHANIYKVVKRDVCLQEDRNHLSHDMRREGFKTWTLSHELFKIL